ncbi:hypothetical protein FAI40_04755 [Acetobacteraceae bacterium]|nr:hypothetical protein FAI40_04755 [Acetobacteraceae bacterium]
MNKEEKQIIQGGEKIVVPSPEKTTIESPLITQPKDLRQYKYFGKRAQTDSAGNSLVLPNHLMVIDKDGNSVSLDANEIPIPVTTQEELREFMAKAPYFDKNGALQYGYKAPAPTQNEQIMAAFDAYIKHQPIISGLGMTNSPDSIKWAQSVYDASNPQAQTQSTTPASASPQKVNAMVLAVVPEINLPMPPANLPLDEIGNPFGPWYMPL